MHGAFIDQTLNNERMRNPVTKKYVTDKDMVCKYNKLQGWAEYVYKFGCGIIHLSNMMDYGNYNPFDGLPDREKNDIVRYMHQYDYPFDQPLSINTIAPYLVDIFEKITGNLACYVEDLEKGE